MRASGNLGNAYLFMNILPTTLANTHFTSRELPQLLAHAGTSPERVILEISERQRIGRDFAELLVRTRAGGFQIALDDVGARNANLAEIAALRPEWLKVDRVLVEQVHTSQVKQDLIAAIVEFGRKQGSRVLAEGVELAAELDVLKELRIEYFQGFLLGRPQLC